MARTAVDDRSLAPVELSTKAEEYLTWLSVEKGRARNTVVSYRRDLLVYEAFLAGRGHQVDDADEAVVEDYVADRRRAGLGPASVARAQSAVRGLHRFLLEEGWAATIRPPRSGR